MPPKKDNKGGAKDKGGKDKGGSEDKGKLKHLIINCR